VIVEAGGFLDIGDTHYRVPWEDVELTADVGGITVPVTEEKIGESASSPRTRRTLQSAASVPAS
jgi:hypothetical protein